MEIASSSGERVLGLGETLPYVHRACDRGCGEDDYLHYAYLVNRLLSRSPGGTKELLTSHKRERGGPELER